MRSKYRDPIKGVQLTDIFTTTDGNLHSFVLLSKIGSCPVQCPLRLENELLATRHRVLQHIHMQQIVLVSIFTFCDKLRPLVKCFMFCFRFSLASLWFASRLNQLTLSVFHVPFSFVDLYSWTGNWDTFLRSDRWTVTHHLYEMQFVQAKTYEVIYWICSLFTYCSQNFISCNRTFLHRSASVQLNKIIKHPIIFPAAKVSGKHVNFTRRWNIPTKINLSGCALIDSRQRQFCLDCPNRQTRHKPIQCDKVCMRVCEPSRVC